MPDGSDPAALVAAAKARVLVQDAKQRILKRDLAEQLVPFDERMFDSKDPKQVDDFLVSYSRQVDNRVPKDITPNEAAAFFGQRMVRQEMLDKSKREGLAGAVLTATDILSRGWNVLRNFTTIGPDAEDVLKLVGSEDFVRQMRKHREESAIGGTAAGAAELIASIPAMGRGASGMVRYGMTSDIAQEKNPLPGIGPNLLMAGIGHGAGEEITKVLPKGLPQVIKRGAAGGVSYPLGAEAAELVRSQRSLSPQELVEQGAFGAMLGAAGGVTIGSRRGKPGTGISLNGAMAEAQKPGPAAPPDPITLEADFHGNETTTAAKTYEAWETSKPAPTSAPEPRLESMEGFVKRSVGKGFGVRTSVAQMLMDKFGIDKYRAAEVLDGLAGRGEISPELAAREAGYLSSLRQHRPTAPVEEAPPTGPQVVQRNPSQNRPLVFEGQQTPLVFDPATQSFKRVPAEMKVRAARMKQGLPTYGVEGEVPDVDITAPESTTIGGDLNYKTYAKPKTMKARRESLRSVQKRGALAETPGETVSGGSYAFSQREAAALPMGEAPGDRQALDSGVREQAANAEGAPYAGPERRAQPREANGRMSAEDAYRDEFRAATGMGVGDEMAPEIRKRGHEAGMRAQEDILRKHGERGAVSIAPVVEASGAIARGFRNFTRNDTLRSIEERFPKTHEALGRLSDSWATAPNEAHLRAKEFRKGFDADTVHKWELAADEGRMRSVGKTLRGNDKEFDAAFPTDQHLMAFVQSPQAQALSRQYIRAHAPIEAQNIQAGVDPNTQGNALFPGVHRNMRAKTEHEAGKGGMFKRVGRAIVGQTLERSPYANKFTGEAEHGYHHETEKQFESAIGEARWSTRLANVRETGIAEGAMVPRGKKAPKGWRPFSQRLDQKLNTKGKLGKHTMMVHPDVSVAVANMLDIDDPSQAFSGPLGQIGRGAVRLSTSGIAEAAGHVGANVLPTGVRAGDLGGAGAAVRVAKYHADMEQFHKDNLRIGEYGAARTAFDRTGIAKIVSPLSKEVELWDTATKVSVLDHVEALIKAGKAPDTYATRRNAMLQAGNYNNMTVPLAMRVIKNTPLLNVFATAGVTAIGNAGRTAMLSEGVKATSLGSRAQMAMRAAAPIAAYLMLVGAWNKTHENTYFPADIDWWLPVGPKVRDPKTGQVRRESAWWGKPLAMLSGLDNVMRSTGAGEFTNAVIRGESISQATLDGLVQFVEKPYESTVGGPIHRVMEDIKPQYGHEPTWKQVGKAGLDLTPLLSAGLGVYEGAKHGDWGRLASSQFGSFMPRKGPSVTELGHRRRK